MKSKLLPSLYVASPLLAALSMGTSQAYATDYTYLVTLSSKTDYTDNRTLRSNTKAPVTKQIISPGLSNRFASSRYKVDISGTADIVQSFNDDVEDDRVDYRSYLSAEYRFPLSVVNAKADFSQRSQFDSQFEDTGVNAVDGRRTDLSGYFSWTRRLSNHRHAALQAGVQRSTFSEDELNDFLSYDAQASLSQDFSKKLKVIVTVGARKIEPKSADIPDTQTAFSVASSEFRVLEHLTFNAKAGAIYIDNNLAEETDWTGEVGITYDNSAVQFNVSAARDFSPSGTGALREENQVKARLAYNATSRFGLGVEGGYRKSENFGSDRSDEQIYASPYLRWALTEKLETRVSYRWRRQELASDNNTANSNSVLFRLDYRFPRNSLDD